jgi:hypothetical protein
MKAVQTKNIMFFINGTNDDADKPGYKSRSQRWVLNSLHTSEKINRKDRKITHRQKQNKEKPATWARQL